MALYYDFYVRLNVLHHHHCQCSAYKDKSKFLQSFLSDDIRFNCA